MPTGWNEYVREFWREHAQANAESWSYREAAGKQFAEAFVAGLQAGLNRPGNITVVKDN